MNRQSIIEKLISVRGDRLSNIDKQFLSILKDERYPDVNIMRWLELKADYKLSLQMDNIIGWSF